MMQNTLIGSCIALEPILQRQMKIRHGQETWGLTPYLFFLGAIL